MQSDAAYVVMIYKLNTYKSNVISALQDPSHMPGVYKQIELLPN
jgi:hypothetical protein